MEHRDFWLAVIYGIMALFWLPAYILIARRGFIEKTFGMPIVAMLGNWPWEWIYGLKLDSPCLQVWDACRKVEGWLQLANFASACLDTFIVYTVFKFGRDKISNPFFKKYYYPILIFGLIASFAIQVTFIREVGFPNPQHQLVGGQDQPFFIGDEGGTYSGFILTFIMGILFIQMLTERDSLEGQSFIIALAMTLGNVAAYVFVLAVKTESPFLDALFYCTLIVNVVYTIMTYRKTIELNINPWTRW